MQTLTSIRRREWSGRIASLPLFFLFFVFFAKLRPQVALCVRSGPMIEGSKRVVPRKEVPFWGLNDVPLNFGGKI